jgi:hypothetical protein
MSTAEVCAPVIETLEIDERHAVKVARWIAECGGCAVWGCLDLSDPSRQFFTPSKLTDGTPSSAPHWSSPRVPQRIVTDAVEVEVVTHREVRRIRIAVRPGYGLGWKLTDVSSARLRKALHEAGQGAVHVFDGNEAIIFAEVSRTPLPQWLAEHPDAKAT